MSSLLNNASLLLNPAGSTIAYKEDKINSVIPNNGAGDFGFSGGDGGTRVNQDGYIEVTPFNWFTYSNALNTAPWSMNITGGQTGKDGDANAWLLTKATSTSSDYYSVKPNDGVQTVSFYVKKESSKGIKPYAIGSIALFASINIETGVVISKSSGVEVVVEAYNSSWWRIHVTANVINSFWYWYVTDASGNQIASTVTLQDMQLVYGNFIKPYQPTTDRLNYPRIDYQDGRGKLLLELQRVNQLLYSNKFDESVWAKSSVPVTANAAISPDGTNNAWKLVPDTTTAVGHYMLQNSSVTSGTKYVQTIFAKAGGYQWLQFAPSTGFGSSYVNFNLANGTIGTNTTGFIATIVPFRDGWYRCSLAHTAISTTTGGRIVIAPIQSDSQGRLPTWSGDGTSGIYIYGAQLEYGGHPSIVVNINYPTSYIPTTSATVNRPNDYSVRSNASSLLSQNDGTLYVSAVSRNTDQEFVAVSSVGMNTSDIVIAYQSGGALNVRCYANSSLITNGTFTLPVGSYFKAAIRYKNGDSAVYVNGQQRTTNATAFSFANALNVIQAYSSAYYYASPGGSGLGTTAVFTSGLSNTQLAELTTVRSGSGGTISYYGPYTIHTFTGSATFTPSFNGEVEVLVVAGGGGGGGWYYAGGGGAGGVLYASSFGVSQGTGITVTVGAGGAQQTGNAQPGNDGSASSFGNLSAVGGGGGGGGYFGGPAGRNGGSGGGGGRGSSYSGGLGTPGQGNNGGGYVGWAGGGGGAGEVGANGYNNANPGNGGDGLPYSITGFSTYYGGGGAGAVDANIDMPETVIPQGGLGGGGNGATYTNLNTAAGTGVTNTGGGGGGGCHAGANPTGAAGGSGIVIVRYLT